MLRLQMVVPIALIAEDIVALHELLLHGRSSRHNCTDKHDLSLPINLLGAPNMLGSAICGIAGCCMVQREFMTASASLTGI